MIILVLLSYGSLSREMYLPCGWPTLALVTASSVTLSIGVFVKRECVSKG